MVGTGSAAALEIAREVVRPAGHWIWFRNAGSCRMLAAL